MLASRRVGLAARLGRADALLDAVEERGVRRLALVRDLRVRALRDERREDGVLAAAPATRLVQVRDDLAAELVEGGDTREGGRLVAWRLVERAPEEGHAWEHGADVEQALAESVRVPLEAVGRELAERVRSDLLVECGEVAKVPEARRELDEVGLGPVQRLQERLNDVAQAVLDGDFRVLEGSATEQSIQRKMRNAPGG